MSLEEILRSSRGKTKAVREVLHKIADQVAHLAFNTCPNQAWSGMHWIGSLAARAIFKDKGLSEPYSEALETGNMKKHTTCIELWYRPFRRLPSQTLKPKLSQKYDKPKLEFICHMHGVCVFPGGPGFAKKVNLQPKDSGFAR